MTEEAAARPNQIHDIWSAVFVTMYPYILTVTTV